MTTKFLTIVFLLLCVASFLNAETSSQTKKKANPSSKVKKSLKKKEPKSSVPLEKYDPKIPLLTIEQYTTTMKNLKRDLLERKLAEHIPANKNGSDSFNL